MKNIPEVSGKDWAAFLSRERKYKKVHLKNLTVESAFKIYSELWDMQNRLLAPEEIELLHKRELDRLLKLRKTFDLIQKRQKQNK